MTSLVITQDAKSPAQRPRLVVPHRQVGRERIAENQPRRVLSTVDLKVESNSVRLDVHMISTAQKQRSHILYLSFPNIPSGWFRVLTQNLSIRR